MSFELRKKGAKLSKAQKKAANIHILEIGWVLFIVIVPMFLIASLFPIFLSSIKLQHIEAELAALRGEK